MIIPLFHEKTAGAALNARTFVSSSSCTCQEGKLKSYWEVVNYLLATYATDDINAETDMDIMNFMQLAGQSAFEYGQAFWTKALRHGHVYVE